jgi:hypothetical protein
VLFIIVLGIFFSFEAIVLGLLLFFLFLFIVFKINM